MGIGTAIWEKYREFKRDFLKITLSNMIAPVMYILVFGYGVQLERGGEGYLTFLVPGVVALTSMNGSFNAIAQPLNVQRLYEKALDQVIISPTPLWQFMVGQILAGALRGLYAGTIIILLTTLVGTGARFNPMSFLILFLNGAVFAAIGVMVSFLAKSHADVPRFSSFVMMPMAFLCNTFFTVDALPSGLSHFILALPLSQTSKMVRGIALSESVSYMGIWILLGYLVLFTAGALIFVYRKENL